MLGEQRVELVDDGLLVAGVGGLEDRPEVLDEPPQRRGVPLGDRGVQPLAFVEEVDEVVGVAEVGVHQAGGPFRVTNKVHD